MHRFDVKSHDMNWDDLKILLAVARAGSFSGAARALRINQSTVSRRIHAFEAGLRTPLVERLPEGVVLTDAGQELCALADATQSEIALAVGRLAGRAETLSGPLTLSCVDMMVDRFLAPHLAEFARIHRGIELSILGRMGLVDLLRGEADIALRVTRRPDEGLVGRRLCDFGLAIYGATPDAAGDDPQGWIRWSDGRRIEAQIPSPLQALPTLHRVDGFLALNALVRAGAGIGVLPCYWADQGNALRRVHPETVSYDDLGLWLLYHPDRKQLPRLRTFIDFISGRIVGQKELFAGRQAPAT